MRVCFSRFACTRALLVTSVFLFVALTSSVALCEDGAGSKDTIDPKRLSLLKKMQRKLIQLPRDELWAILARQQRHLTSTREELDNRILTQTSHAETKQRLATAEETLMAFRLRCGLEDSVSGADEMTVAVHYGALSAASKVAQPLDLPECADRDAKLQTLLSEWRGLRDQMENEMQAAVASNRELRIREQAYQRSKAYYERLLDVVFLDDGPRKAEKLDALHRQSALYAMPVPESALPTDEYQEVSNGMYVYPLYVLRDICDVETEENTTLSEDEIVKLCPPDILHSIRELRDVQWEYNRVSMHHQFFDMPSDMLLGILKSVDTRIGTTLPSSDSTSEEKETLIHCLTQTMTPRGVFLDAEGRYSSRVSDTIAALEVLRCDLRAHIELKDERWKYVYDVRIRKRDLKELLIKLQVRLGLLYGESLIDPTEPIRVIQNDVYTLHVYHNLINFFGTQSLSKYLSAQRKQHQEVHDTADDWNIFEELFERIMKARLETRKNSLNSTLELSGKVFEATNDEAELTRMHFLECFDSHHLKRFVEQSDDSPANRRHEILKQRCLHHANNVIHVEMIKQKNEISTVNMEENNLKTQSMLYISESFKLLSKLFASILTHVATLNEEHIQFTSLDDVEIVSDWLKCMYASAQVRAKEFGISLLDVTNVNSLDYLTQDQNKRDPTLTNVLQGHIASKEATNATAGAMPDPSKPLTGDNLARRLHRKVRDIRHRVHTLRHEIELLRMDHPVRVWQYAQREWYQRRALDALSNALPVDDTSDPSSNTLNVLRDSVQRYRDDYCKHLIAISNQMDSLMADKSLQIDTALQPCIRHVVATLDHNTCSEMEAHPWLSLTLSLQSCAHQIQATESHTLTINASHTLNIMAMTSENIHNLQQLETSFLSLARNVLDKDAYAQIERATPMMDAVEVVCERIAVARKIDVDDAVKECPEDVLTQLKRLRGLEYELERVRFLVDFMTVKQDIRNDIFTAVFRHMSATMRVSGGARDEFHASLKQAMTEMEGKYASAMQHTTDASEKASALYACVRGDTIVRLVRFDDDDDERTSVDRNFASTSSSVYLDYRMTLFDMELVRRVFASAADLAIAQDVYLRVQLELERDVTLLRHTLGLLSAPVLLTSGMISKFRQSMQRVTALDQSLSRVQALVRSAPDYATVLDLLDTPAVAFDMDPTGVIQANLNTMPTAEQGTTSTSADMGPAPASMPDGNTASGGMSGAIDVGACTLPGVCPSFVALLDKIYLLLYSCLVYPDARPESHSCNSDLQVYVSMYNWLMDTFDRKPEIPVALRRVQTESDRKKNYLELIQKELVIHLQVKRPVALDIAGDPRFVSYFTYERFRLSDVEREVEAELQSVLSVIRLLARTDVESASHRTAYGKEDLVHVEEPRVDAQGPADDARSAAATSAKREAALAARARVRESIEREVEQMRAELESKGSARGGKAKSGDMFDIPELALLAKKRGVVASTKARDTPRTTDGWVVAVAVLCPLAVLSTACLALFVWYRRRSSATMVQKRHSNEVYLEMSPDC